MDVYAATLSNRLNVPVNATFTFAKGISQAVLVEKQLIPANGSFTSGPYEYSDSEGGTATFRYVLQTVKVKYWPTGLGYSEQESAVVEAPFEGVTGVTPLLEMTVEPRADDPTGEHMGALTVTKPAPPS